MHPTRSDGAWRTAPLASRAYTRCKTRTKNNKHAQPSSDAVAGPRHVAPARALEKAKPFPLFQAVNLNHIFNHIPLVLLRRLSTPPLRPQRSWSAASLAFSLSLAPAKIPPLRLRLLCLSSFNSCKRLHKTISGFHPGSHSPSPAREPHTTPPSRPCPC